MRTKSVSGVALENLGMARSSQSGQSGQLRPLGPLTQGQADNRQWGSGRMDGEQCQNSGLWVPRDLTVGPGA